MTFDQIADEQGWDEESRLIVIKGALCQLDPTGQLVARYAAQCAAEENAELEHYHDSQVHP